MACRQYTKKEIREMFLQNARDIAKGWAESEGNTNLERTEGAIFSLLATIDGDSGNLPGFILAPISDKGDKKYLKKQGENYFPLNRKIEKQIKCDIAGALHDSFLLRE
jgi:hypothetical protein